MSVVDVTSRQVAPFQALVNMIKIIYMNKPEVFKTLVTVLCDYDQNNADCIFRTIRYIHVLLSCNPDLADYLISFLPEPTPTKSNQQGKSSMTKNVKFEQKPANDVKSVTETRYQIPVSKELQQTPIKETWYAPTVKESQHSTCLSISTASCDVKMMTSTQSVHDEKTPHLRPLMVPQQGGAADHSHVSKPESHTLSVDTLFPGLHSLSFPQPLPPSMSSTGERNSALELNALQQGLSYDQWSYQNKTVNPIFESPRPICSIKQETVANDPCTFLSPSTPLMAGSGSSTPISHPPTLGVSPALPESYQQSKWSSPTIPLSQHIPQRISPGIHLQMHTGAAPYAATINTPLGFRLPLNKLVYDGSRQIYTNPDLSHLLTMTRPTSTTVLHPNQGFKHIHPEQLSPSATKSTLQYPSFQITPSTTKPSIQFPGGEKKVGSLKDLSAKLKIAEQSIKQSQQYLSKQGTVRYKISSVPLQFNDSQPKPDQSTVKHMKSFPYVHRIVLADGGISSFKIDENVDSSDTKVKPLVHKPIKKVHKHHHVLTKITKHKRKKHKKAKLRDDELPSPSEAKKKSS